MGLKRSRMEDVLLTWAASLVLVALTLTRQARALEVLATSRRWQGAIVLGWLGAVVLVGLWVWGRRFGGRLPSGWRALARRTRGGAVFLAGAYPAGLFLLVRHPAYGAYFGEVSVRLALLWLGASASALWLAAGWPQRSFLAWLGGVLPFQAGVYALGWYVPASAYPLSLGWSESSRYYYASLFFSPRLYGFRTPWPALHPSRYLLQSLPFLFHLPLRAHRVWQNVLWIVTGLLGGWAVLRRLRLSSRWHRWGFFWGAVLFLLQAPVYYHLAVMVILVVLGVDFRRPRRTWAVLLAASLWAGISRVNWFPVPAVLTAALYFLEVPQGGRPWWRYWFSPLAWGVAGSGAALLSQAVYAALSGNPPQDFGTSFTSDLLWYRLLPNPTFPQGVLPMALAAGLPALALIGWGMRRQPLPFARWFPLGGLVLGLFAGGLVVSVKIGGGNNLHNLDAWFVLLLLWGGYTFWGAVAPERESGEALSRPHPPWGFVPFLLLLPLYAAFSRGGPLQRRDVGLAREALNAIRQEAEAVAAQGGEVLFISERHLLTFGEVEVPLVPEYERTFLMEMAMAHNDAYLAQFRSDVAGHRFALIVVQPLNLNLKGSREAFGEENDAWVREISAPLLQYYQPTEVWRKVGVQLMRPRAEPGE